MIKIKEETIKALENLKPNELMIVYDLVLSFKDSEQRQKVKKKATAYKRVRNALKNCKGSLSEEILLDREERI